MHICLLADARSQHVIKWARYFVLRGHTLDVLSFRPNQLAGATVHTFRQGGALGRSRYLLYPLVARRLIHQLHPDVLHAHHATSYGLVGAISGYHPFLIHTWGRDVMELPRGSRLYRWLVTFNLQRADAITATSQAMSRRINELLKCPVQVTVIPFGVDLTLFNPKAFAKRRKGSEITIGVVKSLEPVYGLDNLLLALALARQHCRNLRALLVGDGSQRETLETMACDLGIEQHIEFAGTVDHARVPHMLSQMDLFVLPSRSEGFGVSAVEAMAMELPVIASDTGGLREVVVHGETGFLVPPDSPRALAQLIVQLARDPTLRSSLGRSGRARVTQEFDWRENALRMETLYNSMLQGQQQG